MDKFSELVIIESVPSSVEVISCPRINSERLALVRGRDRVPLLIRTAHINPDWYS